ncbi:hypothetical protein [Parabacteroides sp. PF5-9]|uniref:hypothetical protein n=1 Tax=Parabacteroides sp. PF5-9 TaxID=1742404 RepID=UPI002473510F|nr:hypothetical protein [Parabacteroides sp. PF5-9]MDH6357080.1 hypothetical protein [Parabacteroides sp. PF5-9]
MTNIDELFSGVCVIVDDAFGKEGSTDSIKEIKQSIEEKNIPILVYSELPIIDQIKHFKNLSFVVLDWDINPIEEATKLEGVSLGETAKISQKNEIVAFIKELNEQAYIPVFIFSNEDVVTIKSCLTAENLINEDKPNNIFVKSKSELLNTAENKNVLFDEIENWLKATPSIYVLKEWENAVKSAKRDLFWSFNDVHHEWPSTLIKAFKLDGADTNHELGTLIFKNISARTTPIEFDSSIVESASGKISKEDIRRVLERERCLTEHLPDKPFTGCLFKIPRQENETEFDYFLNIRPDCDIIRDKNPQLYCLKGKIADESKINSNEIDSIIFANGEFREKINSVYIACVDDGKIIDFTLRNIHIKKWNDIKINRIGRILPPYITRIQQKYSFYLQRQAIPGLPEEIISTIATSEVVSTESKIKTDLNPQPIRRCILRKKNKD